MNVLLLTERKTYNRNQKTAVIRRKMDEAGTFWTYTNFAPFDLEEEEKVSEVC